MSVQRRWQSHTAMAVLTETHAWDTLHRGHVGEPMNTTIMAKPEDLVEWLERHSWRYSADASTLC